MSAGTVVKIFSALHDCLSPAGTPAGLQMEPVKVTDVKKQAELDFGVKENGYELWELMTS